jgi:hypothetical protein
MNLVLGDRFSPHETRCFVDPTESTKIGWRMPDGTVNWWGYCTPAAWDEMFAKFKEEAGHDIPVEDLRTKDDGAIPPYYRPRHLL